MSAFDDAATTAAADMLQDIGQAVTYRGPDGDISTRAMITEDVDLFGTEPFVGEARYLCLMLVSAVGEPKRGDIVVDENGQEWMLEDKQVASDRWFSQWGVRKR